LSGGEVQIQKFSYVFFLCTLVFVPTLVRAQEQETAASASSTESGAVPSSSVDQQKIDQVIEDAKKALAEPVPSPEKKSEKAVVTLGPSKEVTKPKPQARVITVTKNVSKKTTKAATKEKTTSKSPSKSLSKAMPKPQKENRYAKASSEKAPRTLGSTGPLSAFELGRYQYCGEDRDCVFAVNGCCDCANGSEDVSVNRERLEAFRSRFSCLYVACGEKTREPTCGSGIVSCVNHKCRYFTDAAVDQEF